METHAHATAKSVCEKSSPSAGTTAITTDESTIIPSCFESDYAKAAGKVAVQVSRNSGTGIAN